jgi:hypothetical protein
MAINLFPKDPHLPNDAVQSEGSETDAEKPGGGTYNFALLLFASALPSIEKHFLPLYIGFIGQQSP